MKKKKQRKIILSILISGITASYITPSHAFAEVQITSQNLKKQIQTTKYDLGPTGLQEAVATTVPSLNALDYYATKMFSQHVPDLRGIQSISNELQEKMETHQRTSKFNGLDWLQKIGPLVKKNQKNIIGYNDIFQSHYDNLMTIIEQKDTVKLQNELTLLYKSILNNKDQVDNLLVQLKTYRNKITEDTKNFKDDVTQLTTTLKSTHVGIPLLQKQIDHYNNEIKLGDSLIAGGTILCLSLFGAIAGGQMIDNGIKQKENAEREIEKLKARISGIEKEIVTLTDVQNKFSNMTQTIDTAIDDLQNVSNNWHTIASKYSILLEDVKVITPEDLDFIKDDLNIARKGWQNLKNYTERMNDNFGSVAKF